MSLRTSPQTGVAIRSPFGTAPGDRNCSKGETDCHVRALPFLAMTVVKWKFLLLLEPSADFPLSKQ